MTVLFDLPPELINIIVGHLSPPSELSRVYSQNFHYDDDHLCPCFPKEDCNRQLVLYDARYEHLRMQYETDVLRFAIAHPYIAQCISVGGWSGAVDALMLLDRKDLGIIPCVPEELRNMVRYVLFWFPEDFQFLALADLLNRHCRKINFAVSRYSLRPVDYITRLEAAESPRVFKPQKMLEQFPSALSLHIDAYSLAHSYAYETLFSDVGAKALETAYGSTGVPSLPVAPCKITDLVINSTPGISLLSDSLSLACTSREPTISAMNRMTTMFGITAPSSATSTT